EPVPWIEVHCHGGLQVVRWLFQTLEEKGIHVCSWQEFLTVTSGCVKSAALAMLAEAATERAAAIVLDQYHGAWERAWSEVTRAVEKSEGKRADELIAELRRFAPLGRHLASPWQVAILGAPNVGKSSLI